MEWVETTGRTVEEATARAIDLLGVDDADAEVVVLSEPRTGWFGRLKVEARVRARVRPARLRPKLDRRDRRRRNSREERSGSSSGDGGTTVTAAERGGADGAASGPAGGNGKRSRRSKSRRSGGAADSPAAEGAVTSDEVEGSTSAADVEPTGSVTGAAANGHRDATAIDTTPPVLAGATDTEGAADEAARPTREQYSTTEPSPGAAASQVRLGWDEADDEEGDNMERDGTIDKDRAADFLLGLAECLGAGATAKVIETPEAIEVELDGDDLGLLIGPRGQTLQAVQELTRAVAQRGLPAQRLRVDVSGYRKRRAEALARFAVQIANEVAASGVAKALEPMPSPDRKIVHDAVADVAGVVSSSDGEDPNRRVVISPA